jgi:competence protein ComEA
VPSFTLTRRQALLVAALALVALFGVAHFLGGRAPQSAASQVAAGASSDIPPLTTPGEAASTGVAARVPSTVVVIDVAGAVRRPGLYRLPQGSRIADAVARAGGMSGRADAALVNLAAPLADGEQVLVPARLGSSSAGSGSATPPGSSPAGPVDLNTATVEQLDALPGIGPVTAQKIVDYRQEHGPYTSVDDLDAIPGIGPSRIDNLRGLVIP